MCSSKKNFFTPTRFKIYNIDIHTVMGKHHRKHNEKKLKRACGCKKQKSKFRVNTCVFCNPCNSCHSRRSRFGRKWDGWNSRRGAWGGKCGFGRCGGRRHSFRPQKLVLTVHQFRKHH